MNILNTLKELKELILPKTNDLQKYLEEVNGSINNTDNKVTSVVKHIRIVSDPVRPVLSENQKKAGHIQDVKYYITIDDQHSSEYKTIELKFTHSTRSKSLSRAEKAIERDQIKMVQSLLDTAEKIATKKNFVSWDTKSTEKLKDKLVTKEDHPLKKHVSVKSHKTPEAKWYHKLFGKKQNVASADPVVQATRRLAATKEIKLDEDGNLFFSDKIKIEKKRDILEIQEEDFNIIYNKIASAISNDEKTVQLSPTLEYDIDQAIEILKNTTVGKTKQNAIFLLENFTKVDLEKLEQNLSKIYEFNKNEKKNKDKGLAFNSSGHLVIVEKHHPNVLTDKELVDHTLLLLQYAYDQNVNQFSQKNINSNLDNLLPFKLVKAAGDTENKSKFYEVVSKWIIHKSQFDVLRSEIRHADQNKQNIRALFNMSAITEGSARHLVDTGAGDIDIPALFREISDKAKIFDKYAEFRDKARQIANESQPSADTKKLFNELGLDDKSIRAFYEDPNAFFESSKFSQDYLSKKAKLGAMRDYLTQALIKQSISIINNNPADKELLDKLQKLKNKPDASPEDVLKLMSEKINAFNELEGKEFIDIQNAYFSHVSEMYAEQRARFPRDKESINAQEIATINKLSEFFVKHSPPYDLHELHNIVPYDSPILLQLARKNLLTEKQVEQAATIISNKINFFTNQYVSDISPIVYTMDEHDIAAQDSWKDMLEFRNVKLRTMIEQDLKECQSLKESHSIVNFYLNIASVMAYGNPPNAFGHVIVEHLKALVKNLNLKLPEELAYMLKDFSAERELYNRTYSIEDPIIIKTRVKSLIGDNKQEKLRALLQMANGQAQSARDRVLKHKEVEDLPL